ncbi:MAG: CsgG/HfaB family protein [Candidatus Hydrogenedentota bacterium]
MKNRLSGIVLGLILLSACAPVAPYRVSGFFVSNKLAAFNDKTVAVLPFKGGASDIATDITNLELGRVGRWRLVERIRVQELFSEQDFDPERIDDAAAIRIGKMLGAQAVVLGHISEYSKGRTSVSIRLVDTETGEHLWQARDALEANNIAVQKLAEGRYDAPRLRRDPEALASVTIRAVVETINR